MEEKRIIEIQKSVIKALGELRLKKAIETLGEGIEELQDWGLRSRFNELQTAYSYMLEYLRRGMPDPDRELLHDKLMGECFIINDLIAISRLSEHSMKVYCQMRRKYHGADDIEHIHIALKENTANMEVTKALPPEECKSIAAQLSKEHEQLLPKLFAAIWSSIAWSKSDAERIFNIVTDSELSINDRATISGAIMLSAMKCFEPLKVTTLCRLAMHHESLLSTRAIVAVAILLLQYGKRIKHYPEIKRAIATLRDDASFMRRIQTIQIQLLRCRETQKIDRRMREEIIPAMMKNPNLRNQKFTMDILKEIEQDEDKNPEWKKWMEQSEIKDKIEEMAKWQFEGADIYMSTFSQLKNFPFFGEISNWLRPFDTTVPDIAEILPRESTGGKSLIEAICKSPIFCNSDKYSFCFTFRQVPPQQRDMLMGQMTGDGEMQEEANSTASMEKEKKIEIESNQYIQDLYRFFKLSSMRHEFTDPFTMSLNMLESEELAPLVNSSEALLHTFRYLVEKEYYNEAFNAGKLFEQGGECDAQFFQEMGYCLQKIHDYDSAIDYYTKADIVKPDTLWTLRHIAQCYRLQGESDKALTYYLLAEELAPENTSLLLQTGECLATLKRYDEAFSRFYKAEYLKPGTRRALRAIAWCSFLTGRDEDARGYYKKLHAMPDAKFEDYFNAAHVEWVNRNNSHAIELYSKAKELCPGDISTYLMNDKEALLSRGISEKGVLLLRDAIS
ncbi:MAG: tetratricopeptide repeat protein [Bacteroidales bacterium]|nr:tetratricopeptide repeat protein [Bacteroidales bacterium]